MELELLERFVDEVEFQLRCAVFAMNDMVEIEQPMNDPNVPEGERCILVARYWATVQSLLTAIGNLGKLLGNKAGIQDRGPQIRRLLDVPDNSPLLNRDARNDVTHMDERIERWARGTTARNLVDTSVGPIARLREHGIADNDILRFLDPETRTLYVAGSAYQLNPMRDALKALTAGIRNAREHIDQQGRARDASPPPPSSEPGTLT